MPATATIADVPRESARILAALASAPRRRILLQLSQGPVAVATLALGTGMTPMQTSTTLRPMSAADLVEYAYRGHRRIYALTARGRKAVEVMRALG